MLRGNLSTRPFYNERLASALIAAVAICALLLTGYNATQLIRLSGERRTLQARIDRDRGEAARVRAQAAAVEKGVDRALLGRLAEATSEANRLIDQRTFSWTALFNLIEKTLPVDVRLEAVTPRLDQGTFKVDLNVVARRLSDIQTFVEALRETGAFYDVARVAQQLDQEGTYSAVVEASYLSKPPAASVEAGKAGQAP